jgi:anaerobic magnesium-protoporphyrin IX monomethyl ester cyclase
MARILFTHSYFLRFDPKQWKQMQPYAPLGTLYAAAVMREAGHTVSLHDTMFSHSAEELLPVLKKEMPDYLVIYDDGFNYLTKMCLTNMREAAFSMCAMARKEGCRVIVSGSDASDHFEKYLDAGANIIISGEAEATLQELLAISGSGNHRLNDIQGIIFRQDGITIKTPARKVMTDLDAIPFPAWDLADMEEYRHAWKKKNRYFSMNMTTTRGCPFKCNWCAKPIYGNRYNSRSPQNVVNELKMILENYQPDHIWFCDDIFGLKPGWVAEFSELVNREGLKLRFKIQSRVDLLLQDNSVEALAKAGCEQVWVGAESGSQAILDAMDKGTRVEQIYAATAMLKKYGISPCFFLQFGYPGETKEDIDCTFKMVMDLMPHDIGVSVSYPLPGTKFFENVKEQLKDKANWTDSDELQLMFRNTYPPAYYKKLQRYLHHLFRNRQGYPVWKKAMSSPFSINRSELRQLAASFYHYLSSVVERRQLARYAEG